MKILIMHHCDSWGGAGVSLVDICNMLRDENKVTVCVPHMDSEVAREVEKIKDITLISLEDDMGMISAYNGGPKTLSRTFVKNYLQAIKNREQIHQILKREKYDVVLLNSITLSWMAKIISQKNIISVCYVRETAVNNLGFRMTLFNLKQYCSGVVFISEYDQKEMPLTVPTAVVCDCCSSELLEKGEKCRVSKLNRSTSFNFHVVFLGGDDELKGYPVIVEAMKRLRKYPIKLVVAGRVKDSFRIEDEHIEYVGKVTDISEVLSSADVLVFPSVKGHQGRPIFEAGAFRVPVVVSDFPQTAGEVKNGENGFVFAPMDSEELAEKILWLFEHPKESLLMGEKNYLNTRDKHTLEINAEKLNVFLLDIKKGFDK